MAQDQYVIEWTPSVGAGFTIKGDGSDDQSPLVITGPILGLGAPAPKWAVDEVFDQQGETLRNARLPARDVSIPLAVAGDDGGQVEEAFRALNRALNPLNPDGVLTLIRQATIDAVAGGVASPGAARRLNCRYAGGLNSAGIHPADMGDMWTEPFVLIFHAFDPLFEDDSLQDASWGLAGSGSRPFFPMATGSSDFGPYFGSSSVFDDQSIFNDGDLEAWPVWSIVGPLDTILLTNATTGTVIDLSDDGGLTLAAGDVLVIDTRPGFKTVTKNGTNVFSKLTDASSLWPLIIGTNDVAVSGGSATGATMVDLTYRGRYLAG